MVVKSLDYSKSLGVYSWIDHISNDSDQSNKRNHFTVGSNLILHVTHLVVLAGGKNVFSMILWFVLGKGIKDNTEIQTNQDSTEVQTNQDLEEVDWRGDKRIAKGFPPQYRAWGWCPENWGSESTTKFSYP